MSSHRDLIRQSERACGYGLEQGSQTWSMFGPTGPRKNPRRCTTRLPTPPAAPAAAVQAAAAQAAAAQAAVAQAAVAQAAVVQAAAAQAAAEPPTPMQTPVQSDSDEPVEGYEGELYDQNEDLYDQNAPAPPHGELALSDHQRCLEAEHEVARLRLVNHHLQAEITRLRRLRNQERNLDQLAAGSYWIPRGRR